MVLQLQTGEPNKFDPSFSGPIKNRSCTDVLCLLIFVIFLIGWAVVAGYAFYHGDPDTLIDPTDSQGDICGRGKHENRKFLYFFNLLECVKITSVFSGCPTPQVCVEKCPNRTFSVYTELAQKKSDEELKKELICKYEVDMSKSVLELIKNEDCAWLYMESEHLVGRCIPFGANVLDALQKTKNFKDENNVEVPSNKLEKATKYLSKLGKAKEIWSKICQDLKAVWKSILIGLLVSLAIAFLWIFLMRWLAGVMVLLSILIVFGLLGFLSYYSFTQYKRSDNRNRVEYDSTNKKTWLALMIVCITVVAILLLVLIFLRNRIRIAVALIKEGSRAVGCMMSALVFPLMPYLLHLIVFLLWGFAAIYIASMGRKRYTKVADNTTVVCNPLEINATLEKAQCRFDSYVNDYSVYIQLYNLVGLFWGTFFVMGFGQIVLAGAFASYYWTFNKPSDVPTFAVAQSLCRSTRYHLGSVAFGALLITIVRLIRVLLEYIEMKCKKYENTFTKVVLCLCKCCFWCLEKFIKFINKNAYIMIAVYGKNFCTSARDAFSLLMRNIVRVVVLDKVTDFLLFIGKMVVVGATAAASFYFFTGKVSLFGYRTPELNYYVVPVAIVTLGSYIISTAFFNVYSMGVDTLFLCFLEDCERNDGSTERPYYMSKQLMEILGKKNLGKPE